MFSYKLKNDMENVIQRFKNKDIEGLTNLENDKRSDGFIRFIAHKARVILSTSKSVVNMIRRILVITTKVSSYSVQLNYFSKDLKNSSCNLKDSTKNLLNYVKETEVCVDEIALAMNKNAEHIESISHETHNISKKLQVNNENLDKVTEIKCEVSDKAKDVESDMQELSSLIVEMKNIVLGINEIADQTNLLALNASIEAVRAGEHGKGFVVVAQEVKKLSQTTTKQLNYINNFIDKIEKASSKSASSVRYTLNSIENMEMYTDEMKKTFFESEEKIKSVFQEIQSTASSIEQISAATEEVSSTMQIISKNVKNIDDEADIIDKKSENIKVVGEGIDGVDNEISELIQISKEITKQDYYKIGNDDFINALDAAIIAHENWVENLEAMAENMLIKPIQIDSNKCGFGHFYNSVTPKNNEIKEVWQAIDNIHKELHCIGEKVIINIENKEKDLAVQNSRRAKDLSLQIIGMLEKMKNSSERLLKENKTIF